MTSTYDGPIGQKMEVPQPPHLLIKKSQTGQKSPENMLISESSKAENQNEVRSVKVDMSEKDNYGNVQYKRNVNEEEKSNSRMERIKSYAKERAEKGLAK